jgi:hypothetical protein
MEMVVETMVGTLTERPIITLHSTMLIATEDIWIALTSLTLLHFRHLIVLMLRVTLEGKAKWEVVE